MISLQAIRVHAALTPHRAAIVTGNRSMSWKELQHEIECSIHFLHARFFEDLPTQACYISSNRPELIVWLAAFTTLGIPVTGLDYTLPMATLVELMKGMNADLVLASIAELEVEAKEAPFGTIPTIDLDSAELASMQDDKSGTEGVLAYLPKLRLVDRPFHSVAVTSGTGGVPKLAIRTESFDHRRFTFFTERYHFTSKDRFLVSMPLYHAAGNGWARMFMGLGATVYLSRVDAADELAKVIDSRKITATVMTPAILNLTINALESRQGKIKLRWLLVGGKHFPVDQKKRALNRLGPIIYEYYGTTETGINTVAEPHDLRSHPQSVGKPLDGNDIAIFGPEGARLDADQVGIVGVASYMNMADYSDGSAKALVLDDKRYLLTSEQGYVDQNGRLYLLNRSCNPRNHHHLYRLEDAIRSMHCIADVALLQREDRTDPSIDCAIEVKEQSSDPQRLLDRIQTLVAKERLHLLTCRVVPKIPYSPSGKVSARNLELLLSA